MDPIDLNEERRSRDRQERRQEQADAQNGIELCPHCNSRITLDDRRCCDGTDAHGKVCGRRGCRHCIATDSAGNAFCCAQCGIDIYRELMQFERRSHRDLVAWYRGRIKALENEQ